MKILIDMNLSPEWVGEFEIYKINAVHWSEVGRFDAPDIVLMEWARTHEHIIFTHDFDFSTSLALTKAEKPSVIQVRTQDVSINHLSKLIILTIQNHIELLEKGALLVIDEDKGALEFYPYNLTSLSNISQ